jgi:protein O-GlcNAc transferase
MFEQQLTFASRALAAGNWVASEIVCRDVLDADPKNPTALGLLGVIAARAGAFDHAAACFKEVLGAQPDNEMVRKHLNTVTNTALARVRAATADAERYLVIKSWGFGFWSDVSHVVGALLLAEITDRIPVTHWGADSLFSDGSNSDAFGLYFQPVSEVTLRDIAGIDGATFFPPKWSKANLTEADVAKWYGTYSRAGAVYFLNRPETVAVSDFYIGVVDVAPWIPADHPMYGKALNEIYRYLADKYLRPHATIQTACDAFFGACLGGAPFVAIHLRGSDKMREDPNLHATQQALLSGLAPIDPGWRIFLLTDDEQWRIRIKDAYGDRVITTDCQRTNSSTGVHYLPTVDGVRAGREVVIDAFLALRADRFIGNGRSNVSAMIAVMKNWAPGACNLIGRSQLMERNLFIHTRQ